MITAENLTKSVATNASGRSLHDITLEVSAGALYGVFGPARSGTGTLARLLALRDRPDAGVLRVDGVPTARLTDRSYRELRGRFQLLDPDYLLLAERTAAGNIAAPLERLGVDAPQRRRKVADLLDLTGLTRAAATLPAELSEGQRRRVALARALTLDPSLLVVDEPTTGLDGDQAAGVLAALDRARGELGLTVVLGTSSADVVRKVCDNVAVLADGRLVESGGLLALLLDPNSHLARVLLPAVDTSQAWLSGYDRVADVVLVGHSTVRSLVPAAGSRLGVDITTLDGGTTRIGDTPIARYRVGVSGERADLALGWIGEHGGLVSRLVDNKPVLVAA